MKIFNYTYEKMVPSHLLQKYAASDDILYFDIETTGLSKYKNHIYLIGCGYYHEDSLNIIQWFADSENDEPYVLKSFIEFTDSFTTLVNYNGRSFDIPFTTERLNKYSMKMPEFTSVDIYTLIKPLKRFLSLNDLTQKSAESFLGLKRDDTYNGRELINVYYDYVKSGDADALNKLILHNKEDVLYMHYVADMIEYTALPRAEVIYKSHDIHEYTDYSGALKYELISECAINCKIPAGFKTFYNNEAGSFIINYGTSGTLSLRIPVNECTLKYYIDNYKDYYYIPSEDICIYKSMAGGIVKENRENAKKETCCVKLNARFIPAPDKSALPGNMKYFRNEYKSKYEYIRLDDFINMNGDERCRYIKSVIKSFV